jgi:hypothetical protein
MGRTAEAAAEELAAGSLVADRFRIEAKLGRGGMGAVYRACEERTGKKLALKRHAMAPADEQRAALVMAQFEREFHTLAELQHPRIIEVYDYGMDGGTPFYTMELLDGEDLHARRQRPWRESCALLLDVASSLAILHSRRLLHRDLSPRNVRCTSDGRAKLIDFGAMAPMGPAKTVAGTPMFMPPEALQRQALDGRADLYALGALAYWMLTGRYAYPAKTVSELRDAWRSAPLSVRQLNQEVPEGVSNLVMELLHLDRMARPASAAAVMERLAAQAGLPLFEHEAVPQAYLAMPTLIGRRAPIEQVRASLVAAMRDSATQIVIEGAAGTGRSRLLDACVLEAKLLGMVVLRGDASDSARGEYGLAGALCDELLAALPGVAERAAAPRRALLSRVTDALADGKAQTGQFERQPLHAAILDWWQSATRGRRVVIAVDDADAIDEPSAALLAAIAHRRGRRNISLLLTRDCGEPEPTALAIVREVATTLTLAPFDGEQTEALMRAVFGDVDHVAAVAACMHELSEGNPRRAMTLAEDLVARGMARYEAGAWKLPAQIVAGDLPESLAAEWSARIAALSSDARELAELLALVEPGALSIEDYARLTDHGDSGRTYRALDALVARGLVLPAISRHRFAQRELGPALAAVLPTERKRTLHARIASALEKHENKLLTPRHLLDAGLAGEAVARLLQLGESSVPLTVERVALLERATDAARELALPLRDQITLQLWLVRSSGVLGEYDSFMRSAPPLFDRLERESGLSDYRELSSLSEAERLPDAERLPAALGRAQQRHEALPEPERGLSPIEAITALGLLVSGGVNVGMLAQDIALLERLPSLQPLWALSPALESVDKIVIASRDFQAGHMQDAIESMNRVLARIEQPDRAGLTPEYHRDVRFGVLYLLGVYAAAAGFPNAGALVSELETVPGHRVNAFRVHMTAELMRGDVAAAAIYQRRAELLALQDGGQVRYRGTTARIELIAYGYAADVMGVKRALERIEDVRKVYPGWEPTLELARAYYRRFQGDPASGLLAARRGLQLVAPGKHMDWSFLAGVEAELLSDLGRHDEAVAHAFAMLETQERARLSATTEYLMQVTAEVLHAAGRDEEARGWADRAIGNLEGAGRRGINLGSCYEIRARIAAALGESLDFEQYAERCAREYRSGHNAAFTAKYERLMRFGHECGIRASSAVQQAASYSILPATMTADQLASSVAADLRSCGTSYERALRALRMVLDATGAQSGVLFGMQSGGLTLLASADDQAVPDGLAQFAAGFLQTELEESGMATVVGGESLATRGESDRWQDGAGQEWRALLLIGRDGGERRVGGVACVQFAPGRSTPTDYSRLSMIAAALLESDELDALTWVA